MADLGGRPTLSPFFSIFLKFLAKIKPNNRLAPLWDGAPWQILDLPLTVDIKHLDIPKFDLLECTLNPILTVNCNSPVLPFVHYHNSMRILGKCKNLLLLVEIRPVLLLVLSTP